MLLDMAVPLGLILNELLSNSLKYAFPGDREGRITIGFSRVGEGRSLLRYGDDGIGVPSGTDFEGGGKLGLRLIRSIGEQQLAGVVRFELGKGVSCTVEMPAPAYRDRAGAS